MDSNNDGIGDLRGIISRLDYIASLGVDIIWLCPIFDSPNDDNGYDIRDYYKIHPDYGSMSDFEKLLRECHKRNLKVIIDMVVNHTSDEHEWFKESRKSIDNPYRDFYYWRKGEAGLPPSDWPSFFTPSAWEYDDQTSEYYLHLFSKKQPDLNWENTKVKEEIYKVLNYWLEKGIDGFRLDVIPLISKRLPFTNAVGKNFPEIIEKDFSNGPKVHQYISEMVNNSIANFDVMTVGEGPGITSDVANLYVGADRSELNMIFHLEHMFMGYGPNGRFDPQPYDMDDVFDVINCWDKAIGDEGWISIFFENHDFIRMLSRYGDEGVYRKESAKLLILWILTLRGTPCLYQGGEIGMTNIGFQKFEDFSDVESLNFIEEGRAQGLNDPTILQLLNQLGRDNARTPMQWSTSEHAGFTAGQPWLGVNPNHDLVNVESAEEDPNSILWFYRKAIAYRKDNPTFVYGSYEYQPVQISGVYAYRRVDTENSFLIILNFSDQEVSYPMSLESHEFDFGNYSPHYHMNDFRPWEAKILRLNQNN